MPHHNLVVSEGISVTRGNFGVVIVDDGLAIPEELLKIMTELSVRTAEEFVEYTRVYYRVIATKLGWSIVDAILAHSAMVDQLKAGGVFPDSFLFPKEPPRFIHGSNPPDRTPP